MASIMCKCAVCGQRFDRNAIQAVRHGVNRYSHATCEPNNTNFVPFVEMAKVEKETNKKRELTDYIRDLFGGSENVKWTTVSQQIKKYNEKNGYSYEEIQLTLKYYYEVKHHSLVEANGTIGIVPYVKDEAIQYWDYMKIVEKASKQAMVYKSNVKEVTIKPPKIIPKPLDFFDLGE